MRPLTSSAPLVGDVSLLLLRLVVGGVMIAHGAQKLLQDGGVAATAQGFAGMGVPMAEIAAPVVVAVELAGGVLLVLGLWLPIVGALLAVDMLVALVLVHAPFGVFVSDGGWELVAVLGASALALAAVGGGRFGLDASLSGGRTRRRARA